MSCVVEGVVLLFAIQRLSTVFALPAVMLRRSPSIVPISEQDVLDVKAMVEKRTFLSSIQSLSGDERGPPNFAKILANQSAPAASTSGAVAADDTKRARAAMGRDERLGM